MSGNIVKNRTSTLLEHCLAKICQTALAYLLCSELLKTVTCDNAVYIFQSKEVSIRSRRDGRCSNYDFVHEVRK